MKKFLQWVLALSLILDGSLAGAQARSRAHSVDLQQGQPIRVRYRSQKFKGAIKSVLIRDKITGKRALLALPRVNAQEGIYEATFVILFDPSHEETSVESSLDHLEVFPVSSQAKLAASTDLSKQNWILLQNRQQEQARLSYELSEARRREEMEEQIRRLSETERLQRKARAEVLAQEALRLYERKDFQGASNKFKEAIALDPENNKYYYQYGVSLFQIQDYPKSLVALSMAEDGSFSRTDRNYFIGMNHFRMKEDEKALKYFIEVRDQDDLNVSPTASFYAGVLQYNTGSYPDAKTSFNYVLDKSQDPQMDRRAEGYLEKIDAIEQFNNKFKDKWTYSLYAGLSYDSNILNIAAANAPTDLAGWRALYGASLER
ncbi:MAG: tetratricopeptide repeat protein, partial [Bdellovibrio sp.]